MTARAGIERSILATNEHRPAHSVIHGLDPRIHAAPAAWMVGSSPTMTEERCL